MINLKSDRFLFIIIIPIIILYLMIFVTECEDETQKTEVEIQLPDSTDDQINEYGFNSSNLGEYRTTIQSNQTLTDLLLPYNITFKQISDIAKVSRDVFDVRKIKRGDEFVVYTKIDSVETPVFLVYEPDDVNFIIFDLSDSIEVRKGAHEITIKENRASGIITSSLYEALQKNNTSELLALKLADVFAWQIDFYRIQKGDSFKVLYEEKYIGDEYVGLGKVIAAEFTHRGEDFYAFYFVQDEDGEYFDIEGKSMRKTFLKAPLKFSRISSGYSKRRYHPVLKRYKAHLGTDYAAPYGTPILAVGDGTVIEAQYKRNNGNYVKIKHNSVYTTQYLHMSKFAKGMKVGKRVKQGEVIGYVGSTGLATGPHVCFRFWKNGQQVDHRREKFPSSHPVKDEYMEDFKKISTHLKMHLDLMQFTSDSTRLASN